MLWSNKKNGFTLIELMVVVALTTIMASVLLLGRNQYNEGLVLKNQTYTLVSMIRQAQAYSLGVRADSGQFGVSYGVYVARDMPSTITFFADRDKDGIYDSGESVEVYTLSNDVQIVNLCGFAGGSENCTYVNSVNITFSRPDPVAVVKFLNSAGGTVVGRLAPVKIYVQTPGGLSKTVSVDTTGQVSIQ